MPRIPDGSRDIIGDDDGKGSEYDGEGDGDGKDLGEGGVGKGEDGKNALKAAFVRDYH